MIEHLGQTRSGVREPRAGVRATVNTRGGALGTALLATAAVFHGMVSARAQEPPEAWIRRVPGGVTTTAAGAEQPPTARTPREALQKLEAAAQSGDPETAVPLFAEPFGTALRKTFAAGHLMADASRDLHEAVTLKLGTEAARSLRLERRMRPLTRTPSDGALEIVSIDETELGARAVIRPRSRYGMGHEESIELVRQDGAWKLMPPSRDGKTFGDADLLQMELLSRGLENAAAEVRRLAQDVTRGRVKSLAQCRERLEEADAEVSRAMLAGGLGEDGEETASAERR